jgi:LAGLIDADG DNA endonuclease family
MNKLTKNQVDEFNVNVLSRELKGAKLIKYKQQLTLTQLQKDVLVGTLLGDASIRQSKSNYCVKFEQKVTQWEYLVHLETVFKPFIGTGPKMRIIRNSFHKDYGVSCWFRTYAHIVFKYYENQFYRKEKNKRYKRVPKNIHRILTARTLAYWYMDDGCYDLSSNACILNTQTFPLSDQKLLLKALKRNFKLDVNINKDRHYYRLRFQNQSNQDFIQLIKPYILSSFLYKLPLNFKDCI